ncbi:peptidylprolyl isomerase [bacterium]|nr:peptidylprolyl isomerase [bacterium]
MLAGILATVLTGQELIPVTFDQDAITPQAGEEVAVMNTTEGKIVIMFFPQVAPNHVKNFIGLSNEGFYNGTRFHRCIANFMVQGGDPNSRKLEVSDLWGTGGPTNADGSRKNVNAEFSKLKHKRGILSMARSSNPNSAGSQFFIMHKDSPHLDGQYSAFGKVIEGLDVVDKIVKTGDPNANGKVEPAKAIVLTDLKIQKWPLN